MGYQMWKEIDPMTRPRPFDLQLTRARKTVSTAFAIGLFLLSAFVVTQCAQAQTFTTLYTFAGGADGANPSGLLLAGGKLYGATPSGGTHEFGTVFGLSTSGKTILYSFAGSPDGQDPAGGLVRDSAGNLYGTTSEGGSPSSLGTVFKLNPATGIETVLYSFQGNSDAFEPGAPVTLDAAGNIFGTASRGGASGFGAVYELDTAGVETILYSFASSSTGEYPQGGLLLDSRGNFYGTTGGGGVHNVGVVFKVDSSGVETVLHSFRGQPGDGAQPVGTLVRDSAGNGYVATSEGGAFGQGAILSMNNKGEGSLLYSFTGGVDGGKPMAGLILDPAGNLYGTASVGGSSTACQAGRVLGCGTVFELSPPLISGGVWTQTVLHTFLGTTDGGYPQTPLVRDAAGNLYGTTGVCLSTCTDFGTVFEITPSGMAQSTPL